MTPEAAYEAHRRRAEQYGLAFNLTFEQWWQALLLRTASAHRHGYRTGSTKRAIGVIPWLGRNAFDPYDEDAEDGAP